MCPAGYFYGAGQVSGAGGCAIGTRGRFAWAVVFSPAWSLAAHWPAGMKAWMNANAGAAVATSRTPTTTTTKNILEIERFTIYLTSFPFIQNKTGHYFSSSRLRHWL